MAQSYNLVCSSSKFLCLLSVNQVIPTVERCWSSKKISCIIFKYIHQDELLIQVLCALRAATCDAVQ